MNRKRTKGQIRERYRSARKCKSKEVVEVLKALS
jgi:hypothetical protein